MSSVLKEADELVHGDRNEDYGHPLDDFTRTAAMWSAWKGIHFEPEEVGLFMCMLKLSRQKNKSKRDNMVDLAGYAETVQMTVDEKLRREVVSSTFAPLDELKLGGTDE